MAVVIVMICVFNDLCIQERFYSYNRIMRKFLFGSRKSLWNLSSTTRGKFSSYTVLHPVTQTFLANLPWFLPQMKMGHLGSPAGGVCVEKAQFRSQRRGETGGLWRVALSAGPWNLGQRRARPLTRSNDLSFDLCLCLCLCLCIWWEVSAATYEYVLKFCLNSACTTQGCKNKATQCLALQHFPAPFFTRP